MTHCLFPVVRAGPEAEVWAREWVVCSSFLSWEPQDTIRSSPGLAQA